MKPKIDIVARKDNIPVAIIPTRWRCRHDRVDLIDEAHAYLPARRNYPDLRFYGHIGELSPARVHRVLSAAPPLNPHGPITAVVHFNQMLITAGLGENGRLTELKSLEWLISETFRW